MATGKGSSTGGSTSLLQIPPALPGFPEHLLLRVLPQAVFAQGFPSQVCLLGDLGGWDDGCYQQSSLRRLNSMDPELQKGWSRLKVMTRPLRVSRARKWGGVETLP